MKNFSFWKSESGKTIFVLDGNSSFMRVGTSDGKWTEPVYARHTNPSDYWGPSYGNWLQSKDAIYLCGGYETGPRTGSSRVYKFNKGTKSYVYQGAVMPQGSRLHNNIYSSNYGYACGGTSDGFGVYSSTRRLTYSNDSWSLRNNMPYGSKEMWTATDLVRGTGYLCGGRYDTTIVSRKNYCKLNFSTETYTNYSSSIVGIGAGTSGASTSRPRGSVSTTNFAYALSVYYVNEGRTSDGTAWRFLRMNFTNDTLAHLATYSDTSNPGQFFYKTNTKGYIYKSVSSGNYTASDPYVSNTVIYELNFSNESISISNDLPNVNLPRNKTSYVYSGTTYYYDNPLYYIGLEWVVDEQY